MTEAKEKDMGMYHHDVKTKTDRLIRAMEMLTVACNELAQKLDDEQSPSSLKTKANDARATKGTA